MDDNKTIKLETYIHPETGLEIFRDAETGRRLHAQLFAMTRYKKDSVVTRLVGVDVYDDNNVPVLHRGDDEIYFASYCDADELDSFADDLKHQAELIRAGKLKQVPFSEGPLAAYKTKED